MIKLDNGLIFVVPSILMTWPESSLGQKLYQSVGAVPISDQFTYDPPGGAGESTG